MHRSRPDRATETGRGPEVVLGSGPVRHPVAMVSTYNRSHNTYTLWVQVPVTSFCIHHMYYIATIEFTQDSLAGEKWKRRDTLVSNDGGLQSLPGPRKAAISISGETHH